MPKSKKNLFIFLIFISAMVLWWFYSSLNQSEVVLGTNEVARTDVKLPINQSQANMGKDKADSPLREGLKDSKKEEVLFETSWGENSWGHSVEGEAYGPASFSVHENDVFVTDIHHGVISRQGLSGDRKVIFKNRMTELHSNNQEKKKQKTAEKKIRYCDLVTTKE